MFCVFSLFLCYGAPLRLSEERAELNTKKEKKDVSRLSPPSPSSLACTNIIKRQQEIQRLLCCEIRSSAATGTQGRYSVEGR